MTQEERKITLKFYQKLYIKIEKVLNAELDLEDWYDEVYEKIRTLEEDLY